MLTDSTLYNVDTALSNDLRSALSEESSQANVILQYKLLTSILRAVCSVIQQSQYVLHFYYTLYGGKYHCKITMHQTIFQPQCFVLLNNHQYNCNITKSFLSVYIVVMSEKLPTSLDHYILAVCVHFTESVIQLNIMGPYYELLSRLETTL